jgi:hypothetical protein
MVKFLLDVLFNDFGQQFTPNIAMQVINVQNERTQLYLLK